MARKGDKSKSRKSPDTPRRVGRPPKRRKKSDSESSEEKKSVETPAEVEQGDSSESSRMRRSSRRQAEASTSEPKAQTTEWKEDESFWSKDDENSSNKNNERVQEGDSGTTVWKVQSSNGSGGEIQKLRICRQRPGGGGSDSAESSMSPAKESSPLHKRASKRGSQKSPLVESNISDIELPPVAGSSETEQSSASCKAGETGVSEAASDEWPMNENETVVLYVYETQPSIQSIEMSPPPPSQVNVPASPVPEVKETSISTTTQEVTEPPQVVEQNIENPPADSAREAKTEEPLLSEVISTSNIQSQSDSTISVDTKVVEDKSAVILEETKEGLDTESPKEDNSSDKRPLVEVEVEVASSKPETSVEGDTDKSKSDIVEAVEEGVVPSVDSESAIIEKRRKSDSSIKSGSSRRSSIVQSASADGEPAEPLLEISVSKSPIQEGKEEGEIVEDEKTDKLEHTEKRRIIKFLTKPDEAPPGKIIINRRSTGDSSTSDNTSKTGSTPPATTAKKHPLITGPEPANVNIILDDSPAVRRRKLNLTTTRTFITPGGGTRQVRSIPGEALKAVLLPETEKKEKEKRPKLIKIKEEKVESGGGEKSANESKLDMVDDVREILKNNRSAEKKVSVRSTRSEKSPIKISNVETKVPSRKVSIGATPLIEEVKAVKPSRSKSPGDSKATPVLFITNLVRPFTAGQLKELLARTGTIAENGFFIDKIKSKCFVKYVDVEMAIETRHALNGVRWPVSNPKILKVAYASEKELKATQDSAEGEIVDDLSTPRGSSGSGWLSSEQAVSKDKEKYKVSAPATREWDRGKPKSGADDVIFINEYKKEEKYRHITAEIERNEKHREREKVNKDRDESTNSRNHSVSERERDRRKRKSPLVTENSPPPLRKFKKKDYDAPAKLLDDLFRKTKTSPCLYWLPLSAEQIAVKEETRRKHMAEHELMIAEFKKSALRRRDKERDRERRRK